MSIVEKYTDRDALRDASDFSEKHRGKWFEQDFTSQEIAVQLKQRMIGQERVIDKISKLLSGYSGSLTTEKPVLSLLLTGPPGVGKTELLKALAEFLFGDEYQRFVVDVVSLHVHGITSLIGWPEGYAGSNEWGALTKHLQQAPETLIWLDDLKKAGKDPNAEIYKMLLTLLDEGYVVEQSVQQKVGATGSIVIATTTIPYKNLSDWLPEEVLSRFDLITMLDPWSDENTAEVCVLHALNLAKRYKLELDYVDPKWLANFVKILKPRIDKEGMRAMMWMLEHQLVDYFHDAEEEGASKVRLNFEEAPESKDGWRLSVEPTEWKDI